MDRRYIEQDKYPTIRLALHDYFSGMKTGTQFYGRELEDWVKRQMPSRHATYTDTILREARKYYRACFRRVNMNKSLYERTGANA